MNIKNFKKITAMAALAAICIALTACGGAEPTPTITPTTTAPVETTVPETTVPETTVPETTVPETTAPETTAPETTVPETTAPIETEGANGDTTMSGDWTDMQFELDGVQFQLPMTIKDLEDAGWTVELVTYGIEEGYQLDANSKLLASFQVTNPDYPFEFLSSADLSVQLWNTTDEPLPLSECEIYRINLDVTYAIKDGNPYPMLTLGNGLKLGDSCETVEALCGPEENPYESPNAADLGFVTMEYHVTDEENIFRHYNLRVYVYEEYGIAKIELYLA